MRFGDIHFAQNLISLGISCKLLAEDFVHAGLRSGAQRSVPMSLFATVQAVTTELTFAVFPNPFRRFG